MKEILKTLAENPECTICGALMDTDENCGGDCVYCMAEAGDPDCIQSCINEARGYRRAKTSAGAVELETATLPEPPTAQPSEVEKHDEVLRLAEGLRDAVEWLVPMAKSHAYREAPSARAACLPIIEHAEANKQAYESAKLEAGKEGA
jgi:hypothetical protein